MKGVTLLELLMVVAIIAVVAAVAVPSMSRYRAKQETVRSVDQIVGVINQVKFKAMQDRCSWRIHFDAAGASYLAYADSNGNGAMDAGEERLATYDLGRQVSFSSSCSRGPNNSSVPADGISLASNTLTINKLGSSNAGTIYLDGPGDPVAIRILPAAARPQIWRYAGSWTQQ